MLSNNDILLIKEGPFPTKVIDEGDSLDLDAKIHSFYWDWDGFKQHDYEPVAIMSEEKCALSRYHWRGLIIWKDYDVKNNKPVTYFTKIWHTPIICSRHKATYSNPSDYLDHLYLIGYLLPAIEKMSKKPETYQHHKYDEKMVDEDIPQESRFTWDSLDYYVLVAPFSNLNTLPTKLTKKIIDILRK